MKEENELKVFLFYMQMCLLTTLKEVGKVQNPVHSGTHTMTQGALWEILTMD